MNNLTHSFSVALATEIGLNEAIVLQHFYFWHQLNSDNKDMFKDGRVWCFSSLRSICKVFPYLSFQKVRTCIEHLISSGYLLKGDYNENKLYKTVWYSLTDTALAFFDDGENDKETGKEDDENNKCIGQNNTPFVKSTHHLLNQHIDNNNKDNNNKIIRVVPPFSSEEFLTVWETLLRQPKWKKKSEDAIRMSAEKLKEVSEREAIKMIRNTIEGNWQGLFALDEKELKKMRGGMSEELYNRLHPHTEEKDYGESTL